MCAVLLVRAFAAALLPPAGPGPWSPSRVDVNRAGVPELCTLPGIGPARAEAIVLHRVRHGWFRSVEQLTEVDGLGAETVAALASHAVAGPPPAGR